MELALIDGNSLINRAFYATPMLTDPQGRFTNAVYGFVNMLLKMIADDKPEYLMVAFDRKAPTFRHKLYEGYKATRKGMPEELASQMPILKDVLSRMKICMVEQDGIEADDILGTAAKRFSLPTVIYTGDKDALQLVDATTSVFLTRRGITDLVKVTPENIRELFGYDADGVVEFKALRGDASDNIPGVPGIGEKGALDLLNRYQTVENLYKNLDEITGKLREKLEAGREMAELSHRLATIDTNCDIALELADMRLQFPFDRSVYEAFRELGFKTFLKREVFADGEPEPAAQKAEVIAIRSSAELEEVLSRERGEFAFLPLANVHLAWNETREYEVQIAENLLSEGLDYAEVVQKLAGTGSRAVVFDGKSLRHRHAGLGLGVDLAVADDLMILKYVAEGSVKDGIDALVDRKDAPAAAMMRLRRELLDLVAANGQERLYREIELPLSDVLYDMERTGFRIDLEKLDETGRKYAAELKSLTERIYAIAGHPFNINSTKQLGTVLFEELGLRGGKKTKTGYSTDIDVLDELDGFHPIIPLLKRFRQIFKLNGTYVEGLRAVADANHVVHTVFRQAQTATGRLSSTEPNLQNIPVRDEEGREIRKLVLPSADDRVIVSADYSQIELRLLAAFSGDEALIETFRKGGDIHALTASGVFGTPIGQVTAEERRRAKAVNFGIIYGISDFGLSRQLSIPVRQAREIIEKYFATYPRVHAFMEENVAFAREHGYGLTKCNRIRKFPELHSPNYNVRSFGERAAMNMPLQGTAADIIKIAMNDVARELKRAGLRAKLILQVHDELIVDAPESEREEAESILKRCMEGAFPLPVPLSVNVSAGKNWYEAK